MVKLDEVKSITLLALPLMAAFLAQKGMQVIDTLMMGWIGPAALAAGSLGMAVYITTLVFCMGTLSAVGVFITHAKGANEIEKIRTIMQHGICLTFLLSLPCICLIWFSPHLLILAGQNSLVVNNVALLLHGLVWGFPAFLLFLVFREFVSAFSLTSVVMFVALSSIPITFTANYVFIYGKYGFPKLGIAGIGYAGAMVMWFMFFCLLAYSKKKSILKDFISFNEFHFDYQQILSMLHVGVPSGALFVLESGMFFAATLMMGFFGVDALAAFQITMQCANVAYAIPISLSMATALRVGHASGAKNLLELKNSVVVSLTVGLTFSLLVAVSFIYASTFFIKLFLTHTEPHYEEIKNLTISFFTVAAFFQCLDAVQAIANGALRGMKDTFIPMILSIACYWLIGVSSIYFFAFHTRLGPVGVWYGLTAGITAAGIFLMCRYLIKLKSLINAVKAK